MKTVFSNSEVAHVWAQQNQNEGRNPGGSFYFYNKTIYSYGRHFPIATFHDSGAVLFTTQGYSNTTSRHISHVCSAISHKTVVYMKNIVTGKGSKSEHVLNIQDFFSNLRDYVGKQERARKADYTWDINREIEYIQDYVNLFPKCKKYLSKPELAVYENGTEGLDQIDDVLSLTTERLRLLTPRKERLKRRTE